MSSWNPVANSVTVKFLARTKPNLRALLRAHLPIKFEPMVATGSAPVSLHLDYAGYSTGDTPELIATVLRIHDQVSDLIFSPGRLPQIIIHGALVTLEGQGLRVMTADDTRRIASDLIGNNKQAINLLREQGFCDVSYSLPGCGRLRVNTFIQRGSCAVVMRVIPTSIPDFASLGLPAHLADIASLNDGLVLVTGSPGSGKSSTLAALVNHINQTRTCHIITIEDPIEFLHNHQRATVHQRELHSDTPSLALGLRAALRQSPDVIMIGDLRDRETIDLAMEAAETGHLVFSALNTVDAAQTVERLVNVFAVVEQSSVRSRLAKAFRAIISQRLIPAKGAIGRVPVLEILKLSPHTIAHLDTPGVSRDDLLQVIKDGAAEGMQHFDGEIEKLVQRGMIDAETALGYATDREAMRRSLQLA